MPDEERNLPDMDADQLLAFTTGLDALVELMHAVEARFVMEGFTPDQAKDLTVSWYKGVVS